MPVLYYFATASYIIPLTISVCKYSSIKINFKYLFYFLCFAAISEITAYSYHEITHKSTHPLMHFYVPLEVVFFALIYYGKLTNRNQRRFILIAVLLFVPFAVLNMIFINGIHSYPTVTRSLNALIMVIFSVMYYYKVMVEGKIEKLSREPMIWINTAVLIYFSVNLFYHAFSNFIRQESIQFSLDTVYFFYVLLIAFYLLISVGLLQVKKIPKK